MSIDTITGLLAALSALLGALGGLITATLKLRSAARQAEQEREKFWKDALAKVQDDCNRVKQELEGKLQEQRIFYTRVLRQIAQQVKEEEKKSARRARELEECQNKYQDCVRENEHLRTRLKENKDA